MKNKTVSAQELIDAGLPKAIFWNNDLSKEVPSDIFIVATLKRSYNDSIIGKFIKFFGKETMIYTLITHKDQISYQLYKRIISQI